jgi:adenosyl cobinamide kinase/adenosyl cobinamide phosphate guanylyltransferase
LRKDNTVTYIATSEEEGKQERIERMKEREDRRRKDA